MRKTPTHALGANPKIDPKRSNFFSFTLGFLAFIFLPLAGRVSIAELLALLAGLGILSFHGPLPPPIRRLAACFALLAAGMTITTVAHDDSISSAVSASANYFFVIIMVTVLSFHLKQTDGSSWPFLVFGAAMGQLLGYLLNPTRSAVIDPWKFGIGWTVTLCVLLIVQVIERRRGLRMWALPLILGLSSVHFTMNSRSLAIIVLICGVLVLYRRRRSQSSTAEPVKGVGKMLILIGFAIYAASVLYETLASAGHFGPRMQSKFFDQQGDYGLLFGARKELVVLAIAWLRSPVLGWGPSAHVPQEVLASAQEWFTAGRYFMSFSDTRRLFGVESLPLHSIFLGGLIQAGIFFIPLGLCMLWIAFRALRHVTEDGNFVGLFIVLSGVVHLFMSPLGDITRLPVAMALSLGIYRLTFCNSKVMMKPNSAQLPATGPFR